MGWERHGYTSEGYTPFWVFALGFFVAAGIIATIIKAWT